MKHKNKLKRMALRVAQFDNDSKGNDSRFKALVDSGGVRRPGSLRK